MPWCPKCKSEYVDGYDFCEDCGTNLVESMPIEVDTNIEYDEEVLLTTVGSVIEADVIEAKLKSNGIPVFVKHQKAGNYVYIFTGMSSIGIEIYVPAKLINIAKELIKVEENYKEQEQEEKEFEDLVNNSRQKRAWIIIALFIPGVLWILIDLLKSFYNVIMK